MGRNHSDEIKAKIRGRAKGIYGTILNETNRKTTEKTMGPRMKFEKLYLKDATTPREIKSAVSKFVRGNSGYNIEIVMKWAKEAINQRKNQKSERGEEHDEAR